MTPSSANAIGRTLSRLGRLKASPTPAGPLPTREAVFATIAESPTPVTIDAICQQTGLHANTVRPHLDVLLAVGRIGREQGSSEGRGRPPWLYASIETDEDRSRRRLAHELLKQLKDADAPGIADEAATRWAAGLGRGTALARPASADEAVAEAAQSLHRLGFEVSVTPVGDRIDLAECPYADLVADRPVICEIHASLLQQLLHDSGQPVALERLDVWSRPGVCTAHLRRDDAIPHRTITMRSPE